MTVADVSVRPAHPDDAAAITRVQLTTWRAAYADVLPAAALELEPGAVESVWRSAVLAAPSPAHRVLVALEGGEVVGYAACEPGEDGAELTALLVEPDHGRQGHGSRLLAAAVDLWREDGVGQAFTWVFETDDVVARFLEAAGWGPDAVGRSLTGDGPAVRQRRWHTAL